MGSSSQKMSKQNPLGGPYPLKSAPVNSQEEFPKMSLPFQTISMVLVLNKIENLGVVQMDFELETFSFPV